MARVLEVVVGVGLGCVGLATSCVAVLMGVAAFRQLAGERAVARLDIGAIVSALFAALLLMGAQRLLRRSGSARARRPGRRWLALAAWSGILVLPVAIAVPNFLRFSQRSTASDPGLVLRSIATAEESHFAEFGGYLPFGPVPAGPPGAAPVREVEVPAAQLRVFDALGWAPEPQPVSCRYAVAVGSPDASGRARAFTAEAVCDIDGDGARMAWGYVRPDRESGNTVPGPLGGCPAAGAPDRSTGLRRPFYVGPCEAPSGREVF